jgi:hypothetical protein
MDIQKIDENTIQETVIIPQEQRVITYDYDGLILQKEQVEKRIAQRSLDADNDALELERINTLISKAEELGVVSKSED